MSDVEPDSRREPVGESTPPSQRRRPAPALPTAWRWGFPAVLVLVVLWSGWLLADGLQMILESEQGTIREAVTDPSAPGIEAFV